MEKEYTTLKERYKRFDKKSVIKNVDKCLQKNYKLKDGSLNLPIIKNELERAKKEIFNLEMIGERVMEYDLENLFSSDFIYDELYGFYFHLHNKENEILHYYREEEKYWGVRNPEYLNQVIKMERMWDTLHTSFDRLLELHTIYIHLKSVLEQDEHWSYILNQESDWEEVYKKMEGILTNNAWKCSNRNSNPTFIREIFNIIQELKSKRNKGGVKGFLRLSLILYNLKVDAKSIIRTKPNTQKCWVHEFAKITGFGPFRLDTATRNAIDNTRKKNFMELTDRIFHPSVQAQITDIFK